MGGGVVWRSDLADRSTPRRPRFVSPIQQSVYIAAMAVINGAKSPAAIFKAWKTSILPVMRVSPRPTAASALLPPRHS